MDARHSKTVFIKGIFFLNLVFFTHGFSVKFTESRSNGPSCFAIVKATNSKSCTVGSITAAVGERIISAPPVDEFFLPEGPRSVQLKMRTDTHAAVTLVPSRAGLQKLKYLLLQITEEAEGPTVYMQYVLVDLTRVHITRESTFNYSCVAIKPGVFRAFVKVWALSSMSGNTSETGPTFSKGKYSMTMSNYLLVPPGLLQDSGKALVVDAETSTRTDFASSVWDGCIIYEKKPLEKIQHEAARTVTGLTRSVAISKLYNERNIKVDQPTKHKRKKKHIGC